MSKNLPSVFVVDDEKMIAETLVTILHLSGFAAKSFTDPSEALSAALDEIPDLLLSDVMIPELSGIDPAIAVRQACRKCKVLLFSGHAETLDLLSNAREQGHDFPLLAKPIHPSDLMRRIRQQDPAWALGAV